MHEYIELPRLIDKYTRSEFATLVSEFLDLATAYSVYDQFCLRRINEISVISGVNVWELHLKNQLRLISEQYKNYLRVESTEIDPFVSDYMERQILFTRKGTQTTTLNHSNRREDDLEELTESKGTPGIVETRKTSGTTNEGGTDNTDHGETLDRTNTETRDTTRTDDLRDETTRNTTDTTTQDSRGMTAQLPQSISYAGGSTPDRGSGIPGGLDWQTATAQQESDGKTTVTGTGTTATDHTGTVKDTGTVTQKETGSPTGYSRNTFGSETTAEGTETITRTGTDTTTGSRTNTGTSVTTTAGTDTIGTDEDHDTRERYTGRHESPQDLAERARDYILKTNAFEWLCKQLNQNFVWMEVYY